MDVQKEHHVPSVHDILHSVSEDSDLHVREDPLYVFRVRGGRLVDVQRAGVAVRIVLSVLLTSHSGISMSDLNLNN